MSLSEKRPSPILFQPEPLRNDKPSRKKAMFFTGLLVAIAGSAGLFRDLSSPWHSASPPKRAAGTVVWIKCPDFPEIDCGSIIVPKDYFNESTGTASIALARHKATKLPKKGTVQVNPGGPGGSGVSMVANLGKYLSVHVGPEWDIVGFDPRGIGQTTPKVECFPNALSRALFVANTVFEQGFTIPSVRNFSVSATRKALVTQFEQFLILKQTQAELCATNMGDELKYMGTATVVRDIDFMSKAFDGPRAKINYWGGSYGSILGAYLVDMLPERIGYAVIDGIADPVSWANEPSHKWPRGWVASTEKTYQMFLSDCSKAGPSLCPLAKHADESVKEIENRIENFLDDLVVSPLIVPYGLRPGYLTSGAIRNLLLIYLQRPRSWPLASHSLAQAMAGDGTLLHTMVITWPERDLARLGVTCLDSPPPESPKEFPTAEDLADEGIRALQNGSRHFGMSTTISEPDGGCQFWPAKGPELFTGPWNATLDIPMLIISNTADPITPMASGLLINSLMPHSSRLIIQDGPGHCSTAMPSLCTAKVARAYFAGQFPKNGTVCSIDAPTFPSSNDTAATFEQGLSVEDRELMRAVNGLGQYMDELRYGKLPELSRV